jgi:hypothetical protein
MKEASSIVCIALFLLGAQHANGQELSATVGACCARPPIAEPRNFYDILPNGIDRHSYTMTPCAVVRGLRCAVTKAAERISPH